MKPQTVFRGALATAALLSGVALYTGEEYASAAEEAEAASMQIDNARTVGSAILACAPAGHDEITEIGPGQCGSRGVGALRGDSWGMLSAAHRRGTDKRFPALTQFVYGTPAADAGSDPPHSTDPTIRRINELFHETRDLGESFKDVEQASKERAARYKTWGLRSTLGLLISTAVAVVAAGHKRNSRRIDRQDLPLDDPRRWM